MENIVRNNNALGIFEYGAVIADIAHIFPVDETFVRNFLHGFFAVNERSFFHAYVEREIVFRNFEVFRGCKCDGIIFRSQPAHGNGITACNKTRGGIMHFAVFGVSVHGCARKHVFVFALDKSVVRNFRVRLFSVYDRGDLHADLQIRLFDGKFCGIDVQFIIFVRSKTRVHYVFARAEQTVRQISLTVFCKGIFGNEQRFIHF